MSDYHLHLHPHSGGERPGDPPPGEYPPDLIEAYVEWAASRGVTELGFTEHLYRCFEGAAVLGEFWVDPATPSELAALTERMVAEDLTLSLDRYVEVVEAAKGRGLPVKLGLEVDYFPETFDAVLELLEPYPWDFLIGSVHWIGGWALDAAHSAYEFERRGVDRAWDEYFSLLARLAASGGVDVLAHADVIKKFGFLPGTDATGWYAAVGAAAAMTGTAVEVSTAGLRYPVAEVYPASAFLDVFHAAGVSITLASDAHHASDAGLDHELAVQAARAAGYTTHLRFARRQGYEVGL